MLTIMNVTIMSIAKAFEENGQIVPKHIGGVHY